MGALRYYLWSPALTDYVISVSSDGNMWQDVVTVKDYQQASASYCFSGTKARYIRLVVYKLAEGEPSIESIVRVHPPSYCEGPILLVTAGDLAETASTVLSDADPTTTLPIASNAIIYGDLRAPKTPKAFVLSGDSKAATAPVWVEVSSDLQNWIPLIPQNKALDVVIPGRISLPQTSSDWRYFRLHLLGEIEKSVPIAVHTFDVTY